MQTMGPGAVVTVSSRFAISLILTVHNEAGYLRRTMLSLEEATRYAQSYGITVEIVVVLDRPSASAKAWIDAYDFGVFDGHTVCVVDNGSLGPSRDDGVRFARGEYIGFCDADDLVSYNYYAEVYFLAYARGRRTIVLPQYCLGFGDNPHLSEYFGTHKVSRLGFFGYHPYLSKIFVHRTIFDAIQHSDARLTRGFAYEDWHFNCEAVALGYEFACAKDTIFYYRQRPTSLARSAKQISSRKIPFSRLFDPLFFLRTCALDYERLLANDISTGSPEAIRQAFTSNRKCIELTNAASDIDPAIDISNIANMHVGSNLQGELASGAAYFRLCKLVGAAKFTDVVLLPFLTTGGGEKYILAVLDGISELRPESKFLVLTGQRFDQHAWTDLLPPNSVFVDLFRACEGCDEDALDTITLRLIQATAPGARLHMKCSEYSQRFFRKFGHLIDGNMRIYYRFLDPAARLQGLWFRHGFDFDFFSEHGADLDMLITDNAAIARRDEERLDAVRGKVHPLYLQCEPGDVVLKPKPTLSHRLLWASRLDAQKRPDLLPKLAMRLAQVLPQVHVDVFGHRVLGTFDEASFHGLQNLTYRGGFSGFHTLPHGDYDALLYTTAFDGLPNIILEAMSAGLPVIAPDVGGIGEAVTDQTGFLIDNDADDDRLIESYARAIQRLYDGSTDVEAMRRAGFELIRTRHSREAFLSRLAEILNLPARRPVLLAAE